MLGSDDKIQDWRMRRLTFGVASSPFLATSILGRATDDYQQDLPYAAILVRGSFYVDDVLTGAETLDQGVSVREDLNTLLAKAQMKLRKWRSNSRDLLNSIPQELREDSMQIATSKTYGTKAIGVHWNTHSDMLHVSTSAQGLDKLPTKREIASAVAQVFDILCWFAL